MLNRLLLNIFLLGITLSASAQAVRDTVAAERAFDRNFKDRYTGREFQYETKAVTKTAWDRFLEWLGRLLDALFPDGNGKATTSDIIIRIVAILLIGFVVYMIVRAILNKEGMWIFGKSRRSIAINDAGEQNIHEMDFRQLIEDTKQAGNYRLGVRYYYLWLLKKLSLREIIDWHWDKTNSDYLYEIKDNVLKKDFEYLSYVYDYSWYGEFPLDAEAFGKAEKAFQKTLNTL